MLEFFQGRAALLNNLVDFACSDSTPTVLEAAESTDLISMPFAAQARNAGSIGT